MAKNASKHGLRGGMDVMEEMIRVEGLTKTFGSLTAVDGVSMTVKRGEVLGFLGPNGAGKSTTMRMITGFLDPTAGTVAVCGKDVLTSPIAAREHIGYLPEGAPLYSDITPLAFLKFIAGTRGINGHFRDEAIRQVVDKLQLADVLYRPIETLSKGFKRRVGFAQAILHDPDVLILDEPTDGLDPNQKRQVRALIQTMSANKAIIISTHILEEVEAVCSRAVIIAQGKLVFDGSPHDLQALSSRHNAVCIRVRSELVADARIAINEITNIAGIEVIDTLERVSMIQVLPNNGKSLVQDIGQALRQHDIAIEGLFVEQGHLDDVFHQLTVGH
jgi:ABC-2 type transport system ATP-binding protein